MQAVQVAKELVQVNKAVNANMPCLEGLAYNCWGFTAALHGWEQEFEWLWREYMDELLESRSILVSEPEQGDIIVFRVGPEYDYDDYYEEGTLLHTGTVYSTMNGIRIVHKPGSMMLCVQSIEDIIEEHEVYGDNFEFRRIIQ